MEPPWKNTVIRQDKHIYYNTGNSVYIMEKFFNMSGSTLKQGPRSVTEDKFLTQTDVSFSNQECFLTTVKQKKYTVTQQKKKKKIFRSLCCLDIASAT